MLKKIFSVMIVIVLLVICLGGCASRNTSNAQETTVAFIVGAHANSRVPDIAGDEVKKVLEDLTVNGGKIYAIEADGDPYVFIDGTVEASNKKAALRNNMEYYISALNSAEPKTPEVDYIRAIDMTSDALKSKSGKKQVVILGSGVSTTGIFDLRKNLLSYSNPSVIAAAIYENFPCDFTGVSIVWVGAAQVDGIKQERLSSKDEATLMESYELYLKKCGAEVTFVDTPLAGATDFDMNVTPIQVSNDTMDIKGLNISLNESEVEFKPDTANFMNYDKARNELSFLATVLKQSSSERIYIFGCTATLSSKKAYCNRLSMERAEAVKDVLVGEFDIKNEITTIGLGYEDPWHVEDIDETGRQNSSAQLNRRVVILSETKLNEMGLQHLVE